MIDLGQGSGDLVFQEIITPILCNPSVSMGAHFQPLKLWKIAIDPHQGSGDVVFQGITYLWREPPSPCKAIGGYRGYKNPKLGFLTQWCIQCPCLILHIDHQLDECECQVAGTVGQSVYCTPYILHACLSIMFIVYPKCLADFCKTMEFCIILTVEIFNLLHRNWFLAKLPKHYLDPP